MAIRVNKGRFIINKGIFRAPLTDSIPPTPTPTRTPTRTPTQTPTRTPAQTPTSTNSPTPTRTPTSTPTPSITATQTRTPTPSITSSPTQTPTPSITASQTQTPTPSITASQTQTPTPSITASQTQTPTPSITASQTPTQTPSATPPAATPTQTPTTTETPSPTPTITQTPTPTSCNCTLYTVKWESKTNTCERSCGFGIDTSIYICGTLQIGATVFANSDCTSPRTNMNFVYNDTCYSTDSNGVIQSSSPCTTQTPTPTQTPTTTPPACCSIEILTNNSLDVEINSVDIDATLTTITAGVMPNEPGNGTSLCSSITGTVDVAIAIFNTTAGQSLQFCDSNSNCTCFNITGTGPLTLNITDAYFDCNVAMTIQAFDSNC